VQQGWTLMQFVDAEPWSLAQLADEARVRSIAERLRLLHRVPPPDVPVADGLQLLGSNCEVLEWRGHPDAGDLLRRGRELAEQLAALPQRPAVVCHGDPDVENFLGDAPMLVDFEYAQIADPVYDVALLLTYYPFLQPWTDALLVAIGLDDPLSRRRLPLELELCRSINETWSRVSSLSTPDRLD
jgi:aminoglycoside phosphotransferase (APT) family kinase protein